MNQDKRKFVEEYIIKLERQVKVCNECNPECMQEYENVLFDLILEIRNVFKRDLFC